MRKVKDIIYDYIQKNMYADKQFANGFETKAIAEELGMQRSNVSNILNELVKENKLIKTSSRPVLYKLPEQNTTSSESDEFSFFIGEKGSFRNAIQLAKAAILYPKKSLNVLISAQDGCGTTFFVSSMHRYAIEKGILKNNAPFLKVNCRTYMKNIATLDEILFGGEELENSLFFKAKGGMLFIDSFDLLDAKQQSRIFTFLETGKLQIDNNTLVDFSDVYLVMSCSIKNESTINNKIPVIIELPELENRPIQERFGLINKFFELEAQNSKRNIEVTTEAIKALLLANYSYNVKELKNEIVSACANAYVRVVNDEYKNLYVCINDFSAKIKRGLLKLKDYATELELLLGNREIVLYDQDNGYLNISSEETLYTDIQMQYQELSNRGINQDSIESVINTHVQNLFKKYQYKRDHDDINYEQLSKIVDKRVIKLVSSFLDSYTKETGKKYNSNTFYVLCLHINSLLNKDLTHQRVSNDQIVLTIQNYPKEYAAAATFSQMLKDELGLDLDISEVVIITMSLVKVEESVVEAQPVLLYILHGNHTAQSLSEVTNALTHCQNAYGYDLNLEKSTHQAMLEIKELIKKVNQGAGVFVIYDMGSIKTMLDNISEELDIKIRYINIPITLMGINVARKCSLEKDIDLVYHSTNLEYSEYRQSQNIHNSLIVTLCHTGEGGALQLKNYIDQYSNLNMKTIALSISDRQLLIKEIENLKRTYDIHAFVGTYDPKLFGIPFISITDIFRVPPEAVDRVLKFELGKDAFVNYKQVYEYLDAQLKVTPLPKLKILLPEFMDTIKLTYALDTDQALGIFVHIACLIERTLLGEPSKKHPNASEIIATYENDYRTISKALKRIEKTFKIIIDDNEIATLITIVKQLQ
ncbi:MAG: PRD domain-containing protein [Erysipelotrichales bacterium]|nr:PRD domain-containing protein [Erysipelotrichales bacterium]